MTAASPTPFAAASFGSSRLPSRRPAFRTHQSREAHGGNSPLSYLSNPQGFSADAPALQSFSIGDSSDDELPQPMHFSAQTRALLEGKASARHTSPFNDPRETAIQPQAQPALPVRSRGSTPTSRAALKITRRSPQSSEEMQQSPHRVVDLSSSQGARSLRRAVSTLDTGRREHGQENGQRYELITPAPRPRARSALGSNQGDTSPHSQGISSQPQQHSSSGTESGYRSASSSGQGQDAEQETQAEEQQQDRTRPDAVPSSMRVKRLPMGSGTFLRGAPLRRGARRRPSDDQASPGDDGLDGMVSSQSQGQSPVQRRTAERKSPDDVQIHDFAPRPRSWQRTDNPRDEPEDVHKSTAAAEIREQPASELERAPSQFAPAPKRSSQVQPQAQPVFKLPPPLPVSNNREQENEPPPTFKRNKPQSSLMIGSSLEKAAPVKPVVEVLQSRSPPPRPALATLSSNTPARPAPPPPKMSMLETATAAGGASTVKAKKKRNHIMVNGKIFTVRGRLGRGGSSEVYKVMAENDKLFALKKVNLEDCNEETVRGFKGEIELLKKLESVERVVRLIDWEVNSQKQTLNVLMEMGETDFNHVLGHRLHAEDAKLDLSFTRHYWREMLCCVDAVHAHDVVHSDLKPANFLMVQGSLKLIDFGIANAIDIENTVNVHRETNVGTPNYMSPESLQDTNGGERAPGSAKLMKLGKPSDVWSLGCILYQMTYGKPPFAYIPNQWNRIMAIINPSVHIQYPTTGVGDVYVPSALRRLLSRCLNRDPSQRPTIASMLGERDAFLNPDAERDGAVPMTEELLGQILQRVVDRCRDTSRGIPSNDALKSYPKGFLDNIRASLER